MSPAPPPTLPLLVLLALVAGPAAAEAPAGRGGADTRMAFLAKPVQVVQLNVAAGVPAGFEEFHKPQRTLVDVYFGGRPLGTMLTEYTADSIEFLRPEELVERIPNTLNPTELNRRLRGRLARNSELLCLPGQVVGCGKLEPEVAGVIFDEDRFRADLFLHPDMLAVQEISLSRYLPPPAAPDQFTLVQNVAAVAAYDSQSSGSHTLAGNTWLGRGSDYGYAQWYNTQDQTLAVDQLAWRREEPDYSYSAGLFETRNDDLYFAQSALLAGAGIGRSLKLRTDLATETATRLQLFLDSRSAVEIYRDGRLLSSQFYDPGNQQLDTSGLPYGSYEIEIRVIDATGTARTFQRFFIKTTQLAPAGEPQWYLEGGQVLRRRRDALLPEDADTFQLRGGYRERLRDELGYGVAGAAVATHALGEGTLTWLQPRFSLSGGLMLSTQGDSGWLLTTTGRWRDLSGALSLREARAATTPGASGDYQLVAGNSRSRNLGLNYPLLAGQLAASVYQNRSGGTESDIYSLRYTRNLQLGYFPPVFLNAQITRADDDLMVGIGLDISGFGKHSSWRVNPGLRKYDPGQGEGSTQLSLNTSASWRDGERWAEDVEAGVRATVDPVATTLGADARYTSDYGRLQASLDDISSDSGDSQRFNARYEASFVKVGAQQAFGGRQTAPGGVLIDLRSAPADAEFDIYIDGRKQLAVRGGRRVPLMLGAYRRYTIRLVDRGTNFLHFDASPREVTLYPGTVVALEYRVERMAVAFGRVLQAPAGCAGEDACRAAATPLAHARLLGVSGLAMTEADGSFQAEVITGTRQLQASRGGRECALALPPPHWVNGILLLGDLLCQPESEETAPAVPTLVEATPTPSAPEVPAAPLAVERVEAVAVPAQPPAAAPVAPVAPEAAVEPAAVASPASAAPVAAAVATAPAKPAASKRRPVAKRPAPKAASATRIPRATAAAPAAAAPEPAVKPRLESRRKALRRRARMYENARKVKEILDEKE